MIDNQTMKRYQRAYEQGRADANKPEVTLELAQDHKEYEFYIRGRKDAGDKPKNPEIR